MRSLISLVLATPASVFCACRPAWRHEPFRAENLPPGYVAAEDRSDAPDPERLTVPVPSPERRRVIAHMRGHYEIVAELEHAVIGGDLPRLRDRAASFVAASREDEDDEHVLRMTAAARTASSAEDLEQAAAAVAEMASTCGSCHVARGAVPSLPPPPAVDQGRSREAGMRRHAWAVDRMWEGLVVPSEERWMQGSAMFSFLPGCDRGEAETRDERQTLCHRAQALGQRAHVTEAWPERVAIHGRLLATCASCHSRAHSTRNE